MPVKTLIIIAGMHRAGTSAITGALEAAGVQLGKKLASGHADINELGYKEDLEVIDLHEDLLWSIPSAWDDILPVDMENRQEAEFLQAEARLDQLLSSYFSTSNLCAVKDPRICLFLPVWLSACASRNIDSLVVIPTRRASSVAKSLRKRDGMQLDRGFLLWLKYFLYAEKGSRTSNRVFTSYEQLLENPEATLSQVINALHPDLQGSLNIANATQFISPQLNRNQTDKSTATYQWLNQTTDDLYTCMTGCQDAARIKQVFDSEFVNYLEYIRKADPVLVDLSKSALRHSAEFRTYWNDAKGSRANRAAQRLKSLFNRERN